MPFKPNKEASKEAEGKKHAMKNALEKKKGKVEKYACKSYYSDDNKLKDCSCGKCR